MYEANFDVTDAKLAKCRRNKIFYLELMCRIQTQISCKPSPIVTFIRLLRRRNLSITTRFTLWLTNHQAAFTSYFLHEFLLVDPSTPIYLYSSISLPLLLLLLMMITIINVIIICSSSYFSSSPCRQHQLLHPPLSTPLQPTSCLSVLRLWGPRGHTATVRV